MSNHGQTGDAFQVDLSEGQEQGTIYSTTQLPVHDRATYWSDAVGSSIPGLAIDWLSDVPIDANLKSQQFADSRVTYLSNTPVRVTYTPGSSCSDTYWLALHLSGRGRYAHAGCDIWQEEGDLLLLDSALPFVSVFNVKFRMLIWELPRAVLTPLLSAPTIAIGSRIPGKFGLGAVLASYARRLTTEINRLDAAIKPDLRLHLCALTALALDRNIRTNPVQKDSRRAARRREVFYYIESHLRDADLTVKRTAHDLRMSPRWLHALFENTETTFCGWVTRRRIEECRAMLEDKTLDNIPVAEIAFSQGFNELSTFNRQFRAHYGINPREVRARRQRHRMVD